MAGTATHLAVADAICEKLGNEAFNSLPLFYSGSIAPDAIHARAGYKREFKKHTHLTEGIGGAEFLIPEKVAIFHERLRDYISKYLDRQSKEYDLYLGYVVHLVTDEFFNINLRKRIVDLAAREGVPAEGPELARVILRDMDGVDRIIMAKYPFKNDIKANLSAVWDLEIADMLSKDEMNASKDWVVNKLFCECEDSDPKYFSYEEALDFISYCAEKIIGRFKDSDIFPNLF